MDGILKEIEPLSFPFFCLNTVGHLQKKMPAHGVRAERSEEALSCRWVAWNKVLDFKKDEEGIYLWGWGGVLGGGQQYGSAHWLH